MNNRGESTSGATVILFDKMNTPSVDQVVARRETLALLSTLKQTDHVAFYSLETRSDHGAGFHCWRGSPG